MEDSQLDVTVHLKRHTGNQVLVIVRGDDSDADPAYFDKLNWDGPVGFAFDPLGDPRLVGIDHLGVYGGEFFLLDHLRGGFAARLPQALMDLLLPDGVVEATYPCQAESGSPDLYFTLPDGGSLLSLFFRDLPPSRACKSPVGACTDTSLVSA